MTGTRLLYAGAEATAVSVYESDLPGVGKKHEIELGDGSRLVIAALAAGGSTTVMRETIPALAVGYVLVMSVLGTVLMQRSAAVERVLARITPTRR